MTSQSACRSRKVRYPTEAAAWAALDQIDTDQRRATGKKESSAYRCRRCRGWHLTAQAPQWARRTK